MIEKIADAIAAMGDNEFKHKTFRKHKGKYYIYEGHYKPLSEHATYQDMLTEYQKK